MKVVLVAGARPNFMKIAPVHAALAARPGFEPVIVHTGQHYDAKLSGLFFEELGLPEPVANFGVGSSSHAKQTGDVMLAFENWTAEERPGLVIVVGDVNSTLACGIVAAKAQVPLAHVEAGLRSFDRSMPEEVNRILVDSISDFLFVSEASGVLNLANEGVAPERIHLVGNVMIDTLLKHREKARESRILEQLGLVAGQHVVATLHRPATVDDPQRLAAMLSLFGRIGEQSRVVLPLHPRTKARAEAAGLGALLAAPGVVVTEPMGYLDFVELMATAKAVLTDSGGIQEETTVLGVPCLTLRDNTERPATCTDGTNRLVGTDPAGVLAAWDDLSRSTPILRRPALWDGQAGERIAGILDAWRRTQIAGA